MLSSTALSAGAFALTAAAFPSPWLMPLNDTGDICSADPHEAKSWLETGAAKMVDDYISENGEGAYPMI